ncbi:MAG: 2-C-methyl-D-erythritol 2,4-cyclodiphosphate synthase [Candidatus Obscuribacter sp.]|jgi:2-C-methyl-D-erythritol 2,4-cyclodiphosphate synthase|nr:2-C-methyl-D-erythritol 2,4-cyclodiphosphate synthase [Candidatus Obscuribacter sp.]
MDYRIGQGYDIHRLVEGRKLIVGGHHIEHPLGPLGHSDGDALCHALIDALLGACAMGDIGQHFPPQDARYKDADSLKLLEQVTLMVQQKGLQISNIDSTVILERPKMAPHIPAIISKLAEAMQIAPDQVSVKAKTNEGIGALGRGEAIACHVSVLLTSAI